MGDAVAIVGRPADQDRAYGPRARDEHELSEVAVLGHDDPTFDEGGVADRGVRSAPKVVGRRSDVMSGGPQGAHDTAVAGLVGEEAHASASRLARSLGAGDGDPILGHDIGRERDGGPDVLDRQVRVGVD